MRAGKELMWRWVDMFHARPRVSLFELLDRALVDAPSLCCEGTDLCDGCRADSAPWLTGPLSSPALCG